MKKKGFTLVEMLAVIVILGIVIGLAVAAYSKYVTSSRNKSYNIAESSLKTSAGDAIIDCLTGEGKNREFCQYHDLVENQYEYELVYLKELVNDDYMDEIRDPYNTDLLCSEDSYVYITNKADTNQVNNADLDYKVCLICSNYRSKDCLEDVENNDRNYNAYCKVTYSDGSEYDQDKWTDQDLKLTLTADGEYKYGISYFNYSYEGVSKKVQAKNNSAEVILDSTVDGKDIEVSAVDGMNGKSKISKCDKIVKIDKEKLISAKITGVLKDKQTKITSNSWSNENVVLTVTTNPKKIPSGAIYKWYHNGEEINGENKKSYVAKEDGIYYAEVTNGVGNQTIKSSEFITKIDTESPKVLYAITEGSKLISDSEWYTSSKVILNVKIIDQVNVVGENGNVILSEGGSGVNPSSVKIVSDNNNAVVKKVSDTEYNIEMATNGTYNITVTANDNLKNASSEYKYTVKKDSAKPTVSAKSTLKDYTTSELNSNISSQFNISYSVSGGSIVCKDVKTQGVVNTINDVYKLGKSTREVECTLTGNNGLSASTKTSFRNYYAAIKHQTGSYSCNCSNYDCNCSNYQCNCKNESCNCRNVESCTTKKVCTYSYCCLWGTPPPGKDVGPCTKTCCIEKDQKTCTTNQVCDTCTKCSTCKRCDTCTKCDTCYNYEYRCDNGGTKSNNNCYY